MADFHYIHEHPWITTGAILGGGFILFLILHRRSSSSSDTGGVTYTGTVGGGAGVDPTVAAQIAAQAQQIQGQLAGLTVQTQGQIAMAQIGAGVQSQTVSASQDVTNRQTDAQLQLGLGTLNAQVDAARINATVQLATIDAIMQAFGGNHPVTNPTPTTSYQQYSSSNPSPAPITTYNPPQPYTVTAPMYAVNGSSGGGGGGSMYNIDWSQIDMSNYQGQAPSPGSGGRPTYTDLQASGKIVPCNTGTVSGDFACSQSNQKVLAFYGLG